MRWSFFSRPVRGTQLASSPIDRGKGEEVPGLYFNSVYHTLRSLFLL